MQAVDIKNLYYQMMPSEWQRTFLNSGQVITDPTYTLLSLQRFMTLQEEQNQADMTRRRQLQQRNSHSRGGRGGRSPTRRGAPGRTSHPATHYRASRAIAPAPFTASLAQGGNPVPFRGFTRPPYEGQRSYGRGQPYHPYLHAPVPGRGRGWGRGQRGADMYQVHKRRSLLLLRVCVVRKEILLMTFISQMETTPTILPSKSRDWNAG